MLELIIIIVAIWIISSQMKAKKNNTKRKNTTSSYNRQSGAQYSLQTQSASAKKERLSRSEQEKLKADILSRAKKNVKENDADVLKQMDMMQHEAARGIADVPVMSVSQTVAMEKTKPVGNQIASEFDEDCDIMKTLNDLMIMGYSGNLEFDRDFVAEGIDMLNQYQEFGM